MGHNSVGYRVGNNKVTAIERRVDRKNQTQRKKHARTGKGGLGTKTQAEEEQRPDSSEQKETSSKIPCKTSPEK